MLFLFYFCSKFPAAWQNGGKQLGVITVLWKFYNFAANENFKLKLTSTEKRCEKRKKERIKIDVKMK